MKKKSKPTSQAWIPRTLIDMLTAAIPEYEECTPDEKVAIAALAWMGSTPDREHKKYDGYFSCHYREITEIFGSKFNGLNQRINFVEVKEEWYSTWGRFDESDGYTKGYKLREPFQQVLDAYHHKPIQHCDWIDLQSRVRRKAPNAIQSKDINGVTTTDWSKLSKSPILSMVPANIDNLESLKSQTRALEQKYVFSNPARSYLKNLHNVTQKLLCLSTFDSEKKGRLMHTYVEYTSGRLYAQGGANLQNAPKLARKAALAGCYDYDIENCHFSILRQLANRVQLECPEIAYYIENKQAVRQEASAAVGITVSEFKKCILALMYGAQLSTKPNNAIPRIIGSDRTKLFGEHPRVKKIHNEVTEAKEIVVKNAKYSREGSLINMLDKRKTKSKHVDINSKFAHLLQGVEAAALKASVNCASDSIVLLQHDGFTSTKRLDKNEIENAIFHETGFRLMLEESLLQYASSDLENYLKSNF